MIHFMLFAEKPLCLEKLGLLNTCLLLLRNMSLTPTMLLTEDRTLGELAQRTLRDYADYEAR